MTQEALSEYFDLSDEGSGIVWKRRPLSHFANAQAHSAWNTRYSGRVAGQQRKDGYWSVRINKKSFLVHRVVYALHRGIDLAKIREFVDHVDGDPSNNRPSNLRSATCRQNNANSRRKSNSASGLKGVQRFGDKWDAYIRKNGKRTYLGRFGSKEGAHAAYIAAAKQTHGEFARAN